jgi:hypothetical protein
MSILALTSDTLIGTPATGNLEYNGQFFGTDSAGSRAQLQRLVLSTTVATTSGTSINFTGIPAWVERITVMFSNVSTNGSVNKLLQIGTSGGIQSTSYTSTCAITGPTTAGTSSTAGYILWNSSAPETLYGHAIITHMGSNLWVCSSTCSLNTSYMQIGGGSVTLSGTLDRIRFTTTNGTDAFDAGSMNILLEG